MFTRRVLVPVAAGCLLLAGCTGGPADDPSSGTAAAVPDTARLRKMVLQPGGAGEVRDVHPAELRPVGEGETPCATMWALLGQRGAQAAITQALPSDEPGQPQMTFLAAHADAEATFARLRSALEACPTDSSDGDKATVRYEELDGAGFPEDAIRIRITVHSAPAKILDRIVVRVGACIVDMVGTGREPYPRLGEQPVLRQIERLKAGQGL
ncbi:hypothetical protein [Streptomyces sp. NPDC090022]|uniref:hypothetical protein n=1 Tax=Streptomyces sp. NPDC090022 TaxID=3365920 RepID=UPI0037F6B983